MLKKHYAKFGSPSSNGFRDMMYRSLVRKEGRRKKEDSRPGLKFGDFQTVIKSEPKRILACGQRHSILYGLLIQINLYFESIMAGKHVF